MTGAVGMTGPDKVEIAVGAMAIGHRAKTVTVPAGTKVIDRKATARRGSLVIDPKAEGPTGTKVIDRKATVLQESSATAPTNTKVIDRKATARRGSLVIGPKETDHRENSETGRTTVATDATVPQVTDPRAKMATVLLPVSRSRHFANLQSQTGEILGQRSLEMVAEGRIKVVGHPDPEGLVPTGQNANLKMDKAGCRSGSGSPF